MVSKQPSAVKAGSNGHVTTVASLAEAKRLPPKLLEELGVHDLLGGGIAIPYYALDGMEMFVRTRDVPGRHRFDQPKGVPLFPYGLNRLDTARRTAHLYVTEGESDAWALWACDLPGLGLPGASSAKALEKDHLADLQDLYVLPDNDDAGETFLAGVCDRLRALGFAGRAWRLRFPRSYKDVSDWRCADPQAFPAAARAAVGDAERLALPLQASVLTITPAACPPGPAPWAAPIPLGTDPEVPPFPTDCFPPWLRRWVEAEALATQTPPDLAGVLALVTCGAGLAGKFRVLVRPAWTEPLSLFGVVALPPGDRKTAVFRDATDPVEEYEQREVARMAEEIAKATTEHRILEGRLKAAEAKASKAKEAEQMSLAAEAKKLAKQLAQHRVPEPPQFLCDDVTPEKLACLLAQQGGRMFQAAAEGTAFEIAKGRYSEAANFDVYLKGHAGDALRIHRVSRLPDIVPNPALSVALAVQPDVIRGLADQASMRGRGFLARFLYAVPRSLVGGRAVAPPPVPKDMSGCYRSCVQALWQYPGTLDERGRPAAHLLHFSPQADRLMREFECWLEPQLAEGEELSFLAGWASKAAGGAARLAGILHMAAHADEGDWHKPIDAATAAAAIRLCRDYFLPHAQAAFGIMGADARMDRARRVWAGICQRVQCSKISQTAPLLFTRSNAHQWNRRQFPGGVDELDPILDVLERHNLCRPVPGTGQAGRGHRSPDYEVNPAALAAREKEAP
jgi:hypothetical protein